MTLFENFEPRRMAFWLWLTAVLVAAAASPQELQVAEPLRLDQALKSGWGDARPRESTVVVANRVPIHREQVISRIRLSLANSDAVRDMTLQLRVFEILPTAHGLPVTCADLRSPTVSLLHPAVEAAITPADRVAAGSVWIGVPEATEIWKIVEIDPPLIVDGPAHLLVGYELSLADVTAARIQPKTDFATSADASYVSFDGGTSWRCLAGSLAPTAPACQICGSAYARVRVEVEEPEE